MQPYHRPTRWVTGSCRYIPSETITGPICSGDDRIFIIFRLENNSPLFMQEELSDNSKAILSSLEWDVLDFEDIEKSLAVRLTDDDLHAVF